jgi:acetyl/propionyl-CoA carboxylase alpha subunit
MNKQFSYQIGNEIKTVTVEYTGDHFRVLVGETEYSVSVRQPETGIFDLGVDGQQRRAYLAREGARRYVTVAGETWVLERVQSRRPEHYASISAPDSGSIEATMPGLVREVLAVEGVEVARGDTLVVLEAMKMELRLTAPFAGRVRRVHCVAGQVVERGGILVEVETNEVKV